MITLQNNIWSIPLDSSHTSYNVIKLKRERPSLSDYTVVIVDTRLFMKCFQRSKSPDIIPTVDQWKNDKREGIRDFLSPSSGIQTMPNVYINILEINRWFGLLKSVQVGVISFTNGRHRARYMQHAGVQCFPVEVENCNAALIAEYCGCRCFKRNKTE